MKTVFTFLLLWAMTFSYGQLIVDFEDFDLSDESYLNGSEANGEFQSGSVFFANDYFEEYDSWSGWAISNTTDTETVSYSNQYSAIAGSGNESDNYAVSYSRSFIDFGGESASMNGIYVTNSTFTYGTLLNGDQFSKKFGGVTGDDPDFFAVVFTGFSDGVATGDTVRYYLADYRSENNEDDYIVDEWKWVDLSIFETVESIQISYESSDVGQFGINTPTYACFDDLMINAITTGTIETNNDLISIYPNPSSDYIQINQELRNGTYAVFNLIGELVLTGNMTGEKIDIRSLDSGNYIFTLVSDGIRSSAKIIKI